MDPRIIAMTRRLIAATFVIFNVMMALLWFTVESSERGDARLNSIVVFWIGANVVLVAAWLGGRWLLSRASRDRDPYE